MRGFTFLTRWVERTTSRRAVGTDWPVSLGRGQIFILPSRFGLMASGATVALLLVALNYQSSPVFLLAFFLGSLLQAAMVVTHQHLRGLVINTVTIDPVFAGESPRLRIHMLNRRRRARHGLQCFASNRNSLPITLPGDAIGDLALILPPCARGRHRLERLGLACTEPFATFRAWSRLHPVDYIVYPYPAANAPPPPGSEGHIGEGIHLAQPEDFAGLARYRPGDRPGQIAWRAYARSGELERKHFSGGGQGVRWLDFSAASGDTELRLSILTSWALAAARGQQSWGLRLPNHQIAPGHGSAHLAHCLRALALFPGPYEPVS